MPGFSWMTKKSARIAYCGLFTGFVVLSLILSQVAAPLLQIFPWIHNADHTKEWYQINAILRVSLGNFLFFTVLALIVSVMNVQNDQPDSWHHGRWTMKIIIWLLLIMFMFLLPNVIVDVYGFLSKFGAGLFLLVQFVLLLDFTYTWNDACLKNDDTKWFYALFAISVGCYIASFTLSIFLFIWFNPSGHDCGLNVIFIVVNLILFVVFALIVLQVQGSLFPASAISVYFTYVCFTSLSSEPHDYVCNGLDNRAKGVSTSTIIIGLISTILCVLYSALRAGSTKALLSSLSYPRAGATHLDAALAHGVYSDMLFSGWSSLSDCSEDTEAGEDIRDLKSWLVSLPYSKFHLIFALASMHSAMLLSGWTSSSDSSYLIDIGWSSVWVKICTIWVSAGIFIWIHLKSSSDLFMREERVGYWSDDHDF